MGLDIWSYDRDKIAAFSKYNYIKNQFDIFIGSKRTKFDELYPEHFCDSQYLRSAYNGYGYDSFARIYNCVELLFILQPITDDYKINNCISKQSIYQSLGIAKENLNRWKYLEALNNQEQIYRYDVIKYGNNSTFDNAFSNIMTNQFIRYNSFTCGLINQAINNLKKYKYKKYLKEYYTKYAEINIVPEVIKTFDSFDINFGNIEGILEIDNNILVLFKDDISWYRETAEIIVDFVETLLKMEDPVVSYWG